MVDNHAMEVAAGERFQFGKNWRQFLDKLNEQRIEEAQHSLLDLLETETLEGKSFLDIGSGSGLFSLAARKLGARVHSFDFDPMSVSCTQHLRDSFFPKDTQWTVQRGSVLDEGFLETLGHFDFVYSWGVLHHTGEMWRAFDLAAARVAPGGTLSIAIYNRHKRSELWLSIKKLYCSGPLGKALVCGTIIPLKTVKILISSILRRKNLFSDHHKKRGMSLVQDWFDWLGGYPYEYASVEAIFKYFEQKNFRMTNLKTNNHLGNNEFVFKRN